MINALNTPCQKNSHQDLDSFLKSNISSSSKAKLSELSDNLENIPPMKPDDFALRPTADSDSNIPCELPPPSTDAVIPLCSSQNPGDFLLSTEEPILFNPITHHRFPSYASNNSDSIPTNFVRSNFIQEKTSSSNLNNFPNFTERLAQIEEPITYNFFFKTNPNTFTLNSQPPRFKLSTESKAFIPLKKDQITESRYHSQTSDASNYYITQRFTEPTIPEQTKDEHNYRQQSFYTNLHTDQVSPSLQHKGIPSTQVRYRTYSLTRPNNLSSNIINHSPFILTEPSHNNISSHSSKSKLLVNIYQDNFPQAQLNSPTHKPFDVYLQPNNHYFRSSCFAKPSKPNPPDPYNAFPTSTPTQINKYIDHSSHQTLHTNHLVLPPNPPCLTIAPHMPPAESDLLPLPRHSRSPHRIRASSQPVSQKHYSSSRTTNPPPLILKYY